MSGSSLAMFQVTFHAVLDFSLDQLRKGIEMLDDEEEMMKLTQASMDRGSAQTMKLSCQISVISLVLSF